MDSTPLAHNHRNGAGSVIEIEIVRLRRISQCHPTAWEAESSTGQRLHVAYRVGELTVNVYEPLANRPGAFTWREILNFHPHRMEAELKWQGNGGRTGTASNSQQRNELHREAEAKDLAELRSANWGRRKDGKSPILSFAQVRRWMDMRSENLACLQKAGLAGGQTDIVITAWGDGT